MSNQLWTHCEGSGCPGHPLASIEDRRICVMCGRVQVCADGVVADHERPDILAMIGRGDFDQ